jgi:hypothetical protein
MENTKSKMRDGKKCGNRKDPGMGENAVKGGSVGKEEMRERRTCEKEENSDKGRKCEKVLM